MSEPGKAIQERLERFKLGLPDESTLKKRKVTRLILIFNVILLIVLMFFLKKPHDVSYYTTSLEYGELRYRYSISRHVKTGEYLLSMTVESGAKQPKEYYYIASIAAVAVRYEGKTIWKTPVGDNVTRINLLPGEIRNFVTTIDKSAFQAFRNDHPEALIPPRKSYLFAEKQYLPLEARITINMREPVSLSLNFKYEVD